MVQVFAQTGDASNDKSGWEGEDTNGYELLNEVGSGGTLSSLFTILSLFTEDVKISWQDNGSEAGPDLDDEDDATNSPIRSRPRRADSDVSHFELNLDFRDRQSRRHSVSSASTVHPVVPNPVSPDGWRRSTSRTAQTPEPTLRDRGSFAFRKAPHPPQIANHGTVARATEDTTLAVIPAEAFRRLTSKFPKATAHIVQGK